MRSYWVDSLTKIAYPVLDALARGRLREDMPVESITDIENRKTCTYLEALGRTLCGLSPWLELEGLEGEEREMQTRFRILARQAIANGVDPASPDYLNFASGGQRLVDAAFLAHALLRAPRSLWEELSGTTKERLISELRRTRDQKPFASNWLLFSAMIEAFFCVAGVEDWDSMRIDYALRQHDQWYKGDGLYGDGASFHFDYYNSFVIQPMLVDILDAVGGRFQDWQTMRDRILRRASRYAAIEERLIAPDGTYPIVGRSIAYRYGAFQHLAQMALEHRLPEGLSPAAVRCALDAVIRKVQSAPDMFDAQGFLTVGVCGHQPGAGEGYISTGSLYLCTTVFLPLGLAPDDPFWDSPDTDWTSKAVWSGRDFPPDHAI